MVLEMIAESVSLNRLDISSIIKNLNVDVIKDGLVCYEWYLGLDLMLKVFLNLGILF